MALAKIVPNFMNDSFRYRCGVIPIDGNSLIVAAGLPASSAWRTSRIIQKGNMYAGCIKEGSLNHFIAALSTD